MTVAGVLLAAGTGSRYAGPTHKLLAPLGDSTVFDRALATLVDARLDETVVVTGAVDLASHLLDGVTEVHNEHFAAGQATSLQAAVAHCLGAGHDALVVGLGDQPGVRTSTWRLLARVDAPIAVATYSGTRGNPVRLHRSVWPLLPTEGDEGARPVLRERPDLITWVACEGTPDDVDTVEDLTRWN